MLADPNGIFHGLHPSLVIPIGAKSIEDIAAYVGPVEQIIGNGKAVVVSFNPLAEPNGFKVWQHERSKLLHAPRQLWVHVDSWKYRSYYIEVFNDLPIHKDVIDHLMNRRNARSLGYEYVRLLHISRECNSSHGRSAETFGNKNLPISIAVNPDVNKSAIVYADPQDLLKMLNFVMKDYVSFIRDNQYLFYE